GCTAANTTITASGTFAIPFSYPTPDKPHVPCHKLFSLWYLHRDGSVGYATRQTRHSCETFADLSGVVGWSTRHIGRNRMLMVACTYTCGIAKCRVSGRLRGPVGDPRVAPARQLKSTRRRSSRRRSIGPAGTGSSGRDGITTVIRSECKVRARTR